MKHAFTGFTTNHLKVTILQKSFAQVFNSVLLYVFGHSALYVASISSEAANDKYKIYICWICGGLLPFST